MYSYDGLAALLKERKMKKSELIKAVGLSSRTVAKMGKGEKLSAATLERICEYFDCKVGDIVKIVPFSPILRLLKEEKNAKISGGLYHETQVRLTFNSNRIEGSRLTESQTRMIFETNTIDIGDGVLVDDVIETANHFRALDYVIDRAEDALSESFIKALHAILKAATKDSAISWFNVGEYKSRANSVGGIETVRPSEVHDEINALLKDYRAIKNVTLEDIVDFHYRFECIHPFQDGNGRVGRLIAFKECLKHGITPFIIEDNKKAFYYRGLSEYATERGFLVETCRDGQDTYAALIKYFTED